MATTSESVRARVERYTPKCLSEAQWGLARISVREAILATKPGSVEDARLLASHVCLFLAGSVAWVDDGEPDLSALLTPMAIAGHLGRMQTAGKSRKTRAVHRADLRRISRALAGTPTPASTNSGVAALRSIPDPGLLDVAVLPVPLAAIAAAWTQRTGLVMTRVTLDPVAGILAGSAGGSVTVDGAGTLDQDSAAALAAVTDAAPEGVSDAPMTSTRPTSQTTPGEPAASPTMKLSRAAALRHAKAAMAAAEAVTTGPTLAPEPDLDALPPDVREAIANYRPNALDDREWESLAGLTRRLVAGHNPLLGSGPAPS